jgi:ribosome-associated protein
MALVVTRYIRIPLGEFEFTFSRSSGPGGQNVNKLNTKATLRWGVVRSPSLPEGVRRRLIEKLGRRVTTHGEWLVTSQRFRDAGRNVADCLEKVRRRIAEVAVPPAVRRPTRPTRASIRRRLEHKQRRSRTKRRRRPAAEE